MLAIGAAIYAYLAVALMVIARKTGTPNGWLAWVPIANLFLICRVARRPAWWVLLCLIPLVNIIALIILWMGMAEARGKPGWTGALIIVPLVNLFIPAYLASGASAESQGERQIRAPSQMPTAAEVICSSCGTPAAPGEAFCGECGAALVARVTGVTKESEPAETQTCPKCGASAQPGEGFCGECGAMLAAGVTPRPPYTTPAKRPVLKGAAIGGVLLALAAGAARLAINRGLISGLGLWRRHEKVLFVSDRAGKGKLNIFVMNTDGSGQTNLTNGDTVEVDPAWSLSGKQIAFAAVTNLKEKKADIYVMNPDGSQRNRLTQSAGIAFAPNWSPDGKKILYTAVEGQGSDENMRLYVMNADGSNAKALTGHGQVAGSLEWPTPLGPVPIAAMAAWSPDGKRIAYMGKDDHGGSAILARPHFS